MLLAASPGGGPSSVNGALSLTTLGCIRNALALLQAVSKTAAAPIERIKLLVQNQGEMCVPSSLPSIMGEKREKAFLTGGFSRLFFPSL